MIASSVSLNTTLLVTLGFAVFRAKANLERAFLFDLYMSSARHDCSLQVILRNFCDDWLSLLAQHSRVTEGASFTEPYKQNFTKATVEAI